MFVRADRLLTEDPDWFSTHIIDYHWEDFAPHLVTYDIELRKTDEIGLSSIDLLASDRCICVGDFDDDDYRPCPHHAVLEGAYGQCADCASSWLPVQECLFEPRCDGERCDSRFCAKAHAVYAAFHGEQLKIGMTGGSRLIERGIEQGADAIVPLVLVRGRKSARELEKEISRLLGATQRITAQDFANNLVSRPSGASYVRRYEEVLSQLEGYETLGIDLTVLDRYPMPRSIEAAPEMVAMVGTHRGRVIGCKGRFMLYEDEKGVSRLLDLSSLVSRLVETRQRDI
jgi:hypothetical protein